MSKITITKIPREFIEKNQGEIIIWTASNSAYWTGYYLDCCKIDFFGYIDDSVKCEGELFGSKPVYHINVLRNFAHKKIRMIIPSEDYEAILKRLEVIAKEQDMEVLALIPIAGVKEYNVNYMLGYFRGKLLKGDIPTFLANDCTGGRFYQFLGLPVISPTINTVFSYIDYVKFCENPEYYCGLQMNKNLYVSRCFGTNIIHDSWPTTRLDDIEIIFGHSNDGVKSLEQWNILKTRINPNRFVSLMTDKYGGIPYYLMERWRNLKCEKMLLSLQGMSYWDEQGFPVIPFEKVYELKTAMENYFDIVGWLNSRYSSDENILLG